MITSVASTAGGEPSLLGAAVSVNGFAWSHLDRDGLRDRIGSASVTHATSSM
jgi:hypothetical protein